MPLFFLHWQWLYCCKINSLVTGADNIPISGKTSTGLDVTFVDTSDPSYLSGLIDAAAA